ncbi:hypothetical protein [Bacillus sp. COPE52]|uniref:hypothetical protein n=1 Tax=Bacillus sp. COPE52 TaxID=2233998 RepID=UPI000E10BA53|nr:hypothetical protein [Bacillus sp. COPE52]AXK19155.1 hypothetical protein DPQ31_16225 [Bacillus sp. COPE52]
MNLHFNTDVCNEMNLTPSLLVELIRDLGELYESDNIELSYDEIIETFGMSIETAAPALKTVESFGYIKCKRRAKDREFSIKIIKNPPEADNYLKLFECEGLFSPKRFLVLTILEENKHIGGLNSVEVADMSGIMSKDCANAMLNKMAKEGYLIKKDVTKEFVKLGHKKKGMRIEFTITDKVVCKYA